ncbi:DUF429 domain-containing protein [Nocardioides pacificus]
MYFVGVDLAWGEKRPTGVAVLDDGGELVHLSAQGPDDAIAAVLAPYVGDACLVAMDAPLVVTNPTGNRPAEAALNRDFARFDAGAHPVNTGKPELSGQPRGARLAELLDLDMDPDSTSPRRAIEVYPHPATVALFRLGRTLKYKNKPGRPFAQLRDELLRLMDLLADLGDAEVPLRLGERWSQLRATVADAERKADLRRAEDQVDAVVCAYVAQFADRLPAGVTTYGDYATGYIVTPTLPEGHRPTKREPRVVALSPEEVARRAVKTYAALRPQLLEATDRYVALVTTLLDDAGINYLSVDGRTKSVASFAAKAERMLEGERVYPDPLSQIADQIGVRVIAYLQSDVAAVAELLSDQLSILDDRDMGQETANEGRFGYASRHMLVSLDPVRPTPASLEPLVGRVASVQVRTVLQHAWAEFEHDIRYKGSVPAEHAPDLDRRFTLAAGLLELADREFSMIRDRLQETMTDQRGEPEDADDPRISAQDLAAFLAGKYADAGWSRTDHYAWVSGLLLELGITSLDELAHLLAGVDSASINERMAYRYPPGAVRRLDDALLAAYGDRYVHLHGNAHRVSLLQARLDKLAG